MPLLKKCRENVRRHLDPSECFFAGGVIAGLFFIVAVLFLDLHERNRVCPMPMSEFAHGEASDIECLFEEWDSSEGFVTARGRAAVRGKTYPYHNYGADCWGRGVYSNMHLACVDGNSGMVFILPTQLEGRDGATEAAGDGTDCQYSGFVARFPAEYMELIQSGGLFIDSVDPEGVHTLYEAKREGE